MYSPAEIDGAAPSTVTKSRWPRALMRSTQKPLSALWNVTRSTRPASGSRSLGGLGSADCIHARLKHYNNQSKVTVKLHLSAHRDRPAGATRYWGRPCASET